MKNEDWTGLCSRLREAREYLGLSQDEVAKHLTVPRSAISQIENGNRKVDAMELADMARLYGRPMAFFTGEQPAEESPQLSILKRAASELSETDQSEVLRFAEFLRARSSKERKGE